MTEKLSAAFSVIYCYREKIVSYRLYFVITPVSFFGSTRCSIIKAAAIPMISPLDKRQAATVGRLVNVPSGKSIVPVPIIIESPTIRFSLLPKETFPNSRRACPMQRAKMIIRAPLPTPAGIVANSAPKGPTSPMTIIPAAARYIGPLAATPVISTTPMEETKGINAIEENRPVMDADIPWKKIDLRIRCSPASDSAIAAMPVARDTGEASRRPPVWGAC